MRCRHCSCGPPLGSTPTSTPTQAKLPPCTARADACHMPHLPPKRHIGKLKGLQVPRVASWNESDENIAKKVPWGGLVVAW